MVTPWEDWTSIDRECLARLPAACHRFVLSKKIYLITVTMVIIIVMIMTMTRIMITSKINRNRRPTIAILF